MERVALGQVNILVRLGRSARTSGRGRYYDFLNIFAEKFGEKIGVFDSKQS
jgi:hypothetical protein